MQGASRDALERSLASFDESIGALPDGAGSNEVSEGLYAVAALLDREPSLRRAFTDPASSPDSRRGLAQRTARDPAARRSRCGSCPTWSRRPGARPADLREAVEVVAANAALSAAEGEGVLDDVEDELFRFARLLEREPALRACADRPRPAGRPQDRLLRELLGTRARPATVRLVEIAVTRSRGRSLEAALEELARARRDRAARATSPR